LKESQDQLEQEKRRYRDTEEYMNAIILQRDRELEEISAAHQDARTAFSSQNTTLEQMKRSLDSAVLARTELAEKLRLAEAEIHRIGQDLESASEGREEEKQQRASLAKELERVKTGLENETLRRQEAEDQLRDIQSQQQQLEQDLERLVSETKTLHADLSVERRMHETAKNQTRSLEEQVSVLSREKAEAKRTAASLAAEIDRARSALADEEEERTTDNERFAIIAGKKQQAAPAQYPGVRKEAEIIKKRALIVKVPTSPPEIRPLPRSIVAVDTVKASEQETSHIKSVEDLFEDEDDNKQPDSDPVVSIIQEPANEPVRDVLPDTLSDRSDHQDSFFEDETPSGPGTGDDTGDSEIDDEDSLSDSSDAAPVSGQDISFNRTQWLDLLKWSHHCDALSQDHRMQIVRMGRLIQKGRKLTNKQEEQVLEIIALVQKLGYRLPP
jgi:uncharacterized phage infection (PIP) family protein YhgE